MAYQPLTKIHIQNFQAIRDLTLELDDRGMFWIRGKNDIGKSALLKAITTLFTNVSNQKYKAFIRDGSVTFKIKGYFGRNDWVTLSRGRSDYYEWCIDGVEGRVDKTQGKVPEELERYFNLYYDPVKTNRYLNFTSATDNLLFVSTTGGDNYQLLQIALGTERLNQATKASDKLGREAATEKKLVDNLKEEQEERKVEVMATVQQAEEDIEQLERVNHTLNNEYKIYQALEGAYQQADIYTQLYVYKDGIDQFLEEFDETGLTTEIDHLKLIEEAITTKQQHGAITQRLDQLSDITNEEITELQDLQTITTHITSLQNNLTRQTTLQEQLQDLDGGITGLEEVEQLLNEITQIKQTTQTFNELITMNTHYTEAKVHLEELEDEYNQLREELGVCPYCGSELTAEHAH